MTTSARPFPFRSPSFPPVRFRSFRLSAPVPGRFLFLPFAQDSLSFFPRSVPDTQLPVLPFSPPPVPPPSGFPNALTVPFVPVRSSPSLPPGFPSGLSGSAYSAFLFVPFHASLLRSHSRSAGASVLLRFLRLLFPDLSMRPFAPLSPNLFRFVSSASLAVLPLRSRPFRIFATQSLFLPFPSSAFRLTVASCLPAALPSASRLRSSLWFSSFAPFSVVRFRFLWFPSLRPRYSVTLLFLSPLTHSPHSGSCARLPSLSGSGLPLSLPLPDFSFSSPP